MGEQLHSDRWRYIIPIAIVLFLLVVIAAAYALQDEPTNAPIRRDRWSAPQSE